jgi:RNase P subunit RPR2
MNISMAGRRNFERHLPKSCDYCGHSARFTLRRDRGTVCRWCGETHRIEESEFYLDVESSFGWPLRREVKNA